MMKLSVKDLFNFISSHFTDDFTRLKTASSFNHFIAHYDLTDIRNKYNNNAEFKFANLSNVIESIFETTNPILCGESAISFIDFVKNKHANIHPDNLKWISPDLLNLCLNTDTTTVSNNFVISATQNNPITAQSASTTTSLTTTDNSSNSVQDSVQTTSNDTLSNLSSFLGSLRTDINTDITDQLKFFMLNSLPKLAKDEHFQDLEKLLNKKSVTTNAITTNQGYLSHNVMQTNIKSNKFPQPYLSKDPRFVDDFNKLIHKFQVEIQTHIVEYLTKELETINQAINIKVKFITQIDTDATNKISALESLVNNNNKADLINSTEKLNRKIKEKEEPATSVTPAPAKSKRNQTTKRSHFNHPSSDLHNFSSRQTQHINTSSYNNRNRTNQHHLQQSHPNVHQQHNQQMYQQSYHNPQQLSTEFYNSSHHNQRQPQFYQQQRQSK